MDKKILKVPIEQSRAYRETLGQLLELTDSQVERLEKRLHQEIEDWSNDSSGLHDNLRRWNDLVEGVVEDTDFPFEGASNIHVPVIAIYCKVYHSIERRSILGADLIWYTETMEDGLRDLLENVEDYFNYKARNDWNIAQALSDVFYTTNRDALGILQIPYVEEYEEDFEDVVYLDSMDTFFDEFPSPEDSGMTKEEWTGLAQQVQAEASEEQPIEVPIIYDKLIYRGPKAEVVERADFAIFPATAKSISRADARGYGKRTYLRRALVQEKADEGFWYSDAVEELLSESKSGDDVSDYQSSKEDIAGISRSGKSNELEFFELVYHFKLKKSGKEIKLMLVYSYEHNKLVACLKYYYRKDFYAFFRISKKANMLDGEGIPGALDDLNEEIDTMHNQRINSRKIAEVPSFKGQKSKIKDFDPNAMENAWHPGVIFWLEDPEAFTQFTVQPTDLNGAMSEETNSMKIASLVMGIDPFVASGSASQIDPNAPGNKTSMLIQQTNMRMDDPLSELRSGVETVGEICVSHEYQFGPAILEYKSGEGKTAQTKYIPKRLLRKGISMKMRGITVAMNPDAEFMKYANYYGFLVKDPMIGQRSKSRWELLMRTMRAGRIQGRDKILPTLEELAQEDAQMKLQMEQMKQQQAAEAQAKGEQQQIKSAKGQIQLQDAAKDSKLKDLKRGVQAHQAISDLRDRVTKSFTEALAGAGAGSE